MIMMLPIISKIPKQKAEQYETLHLYLSPHNHRIFTQQLHVSLSQKKRQVKMNNTISLHASDFRSGCEETRRFTPRRSAFPPQSCFRSGESCGSSEPHASAYLKHEEREGTRFRRGRNLQSSCRNLLTQSSS